MEKEMMQCETPIKTLGEIFIFMDFFNAKILTAKFDDGKSSELQEVIATRSGKNKIFLEFV